MAGAKSPEETRAKAIAKRDRKRLETAVRLQWQDRTRTVRQAADYFEVSPTTIQKWRKRGTTQTLPMGPRSTPRVLSREERELIKRFHRCFRLSRRDTLDALLPLIPRLKLSTLKRVLVRFRPRKTLSFKEFCEFFIKAGRIHRLSSALAEIADYKVTPLFIGVHQLTQLNPRLTKLAIDQTLRKHRVGLDDALADRGYVIVSYGSQGERQGSGFLIAKAK